MDLERALLKGLATGVVTALVFGVIYLLGKLGGGGVKVGGGEIVLRYVSFMRGVALLGALLPLGFLVGAVFLPGPGGGTEAALMIGGIGAVFGALDLYLLLETFRRRVVLTDTGITATGWLGDAGALRWDEIESVENKASASKFVVRGGKVKIALSHYLAGLDRFAEECRKRLTPEVYGKAFEKPLNRPLM